MTLFFSNSNWRPMGFSTIISPFVYLTVFHLISLVLCLVSVCFRWGSVVRALTRFTSPSTLAPSLSTYLYNCPSRPDTYPRLSLTLSSDSSCHYLSHPSFCPSFLRRASITCHFVQGDLCLLKRSVCITCARRDTQRGHDSVSEFKTFLERYRCGEYAPTFLPNPRVLGVELGRSGFCLLIFGHSIFIVPLTPS